MVRQNNIRVIVGMSGGVDSSVAAWLLLREGYEVQGLFMTNWEEDEQGYCTAAEDFQDARQVCDELAIPLHRVNFAKQYRELVFAYFLDEYQAGRTPNPDVLCNREIKFGVFFEYARRLGAQRVATGHYARTRMRGDRCELLKASDGDKDQSYFLHAVGQAALRDTLFPLGELHKEEVRRIASEQGFTNYDKKDSTGICFIGERPFTEFLSRYLPASPGEIRTPDGKLLGRHRGLMFYTLGQRKGLGIGGLADADDAPWYTAAKDLERNQLIVVQGHDHPMLIHRGLVASRPHWIGGAPPSLPLRCRAKTRYRQADQDCTVARLDDTRLEVRFDHPQRAITPGQFVVFYEDGVCLGGATIESLPQAPAKSAPEATVRPIAASH